MCVICVGVGVRICGGGVRICVSVHVHEVCVCVCVLCVYIYKYIYTYAYTNIIRIYMTPNNKILTKNQTVPRRGKEGDLCNPQHRRPSQDHNTHDPMTPGDYHYWPLYRLLGTRHTAPRGPPHYSQTPQMTSSLILNHSSVTLYHVYAARIRSHRTNTHRRGILLPPPPQTPPRAHPPNQPS